MEDKTKIKTTPKSIYQQLLENNRKIKRALAINNQQKTKQNKNNTNNYFPIAIRRQQKNKNSTNN